MQIVGDLQHDLQYAFLVFDWNDPVEVSGLGCFRPVGHVPRRRKQAAVHPEAMGRPGRSEAQRQRFLHFRRVHHQAIGAVAEARQGFPRQNRIVPRGGHANAKRLLRSFTVKILGPQQLTPVEIPLAVKADGGGIFIELHIAQIEQTVDGPDRFRQCRPGRRSAKCGQQQRQNRDARPSDALF